MSSKNLEAISTKAENSPREEIAECINAIRILDRLVSNGISYSEFGRATVRNLQKPSVGNIAESVIFLSTEDGKISSDKVDHFYNLLNLCCMGIHAHDDDSSWRGIYALAANIFTRRSEPAKRLGYSNHNASVFDKVANAKDLLVFIPKLCEKFGIAPDCKVTVCKVERPRRVRNTSWSAWGFKR